jgi:hypothetical protein
MEHIKFTQVYSGIKQFGAAGMLVIFRWVLCLNLGRNIVYSEGTFLWFFSGCQGQCSALN